ncbi:hypothetical protein B5X24_HaOG207113 [Helicoverpa armigera]|uniref:Uncharacterized protein n=1 Tax=Helicoverpa armigera TaxID=29058 RepID=A0A2W1BIF7_HELAM|nr:hypothetical protein B5X24_HaOG207113 [Helicoverpa armigera]
MVGNLSDKDRATFGVSTILKMSTLLMCVFGILFEVKTSLAALTTFCDGENIINSLWIEKPRDLKDVRR